MNLNLGNGYPYPATELPDDYDSRSFSLEIEGVVHFEWRHTLTIEFDSLASFEKAKDQTGWKEWSPLVLEATYSDEDGYSHPAIITKDMAYCGLMLMS